MYKRDHVWYSSPFASKLGRGLNKVLQIEKINTEKMTKQIREVRKIFFKIRLNNSELEQLKKQKQQSTERSLSNYVRKVALQKPVTIRYRSQSADEFLKQMLELKKELNAVGNNFNQAVHKLHLLKTIPEFRNWIRDYKMLHQAVDQKVQNINSKMIQLYEQWLQK